MLSCFLSQRVRRLPPSYCGVGSGEQSSQCLGGVDPSFSSLEILLGSPSAPSPSLRVFPLGKGPPEWPGLCCCPSSCPLPASCQVREDPASTTRWSQRLSLPPGEAGFGALQFPAKCDDLAPAPSRKGEWQGDRVCKALLRGKALLSPAHDGQEMCRVFLQYSSHARGSFIHLFIHTFIETYPIPRSMLETEPMQTGRTWSLPIESPWSRER